MSTTQFMTGDEIRLLLYLETCLVDDLGCVDERRMNASDFEICRGWRKEGFVELLRLPIGMLTPPRSHRVRFTAAAWAAAAVERRRRAERNAATLSRGFVLSRAALSSGTIYE